MNDRRIVLASAITLLGVTLLLSSAAHSVAGPFAIHAYGSSQLAVQIGLLFFFGVGLSIVMLGDSAWRARHFIRGDKGQVDVAALFRSIPKPKMAVVAVLLIAGYGIAASASLVELYRAETLDWRDASLWQLEQFFFQFLIGLPINVPRFWDAVYQFLWIVLFLGLAALARSGRTDAVAHAMCAVVIAFHLTRYVAIAFPTAGPVFHQPGMFDLSETGSGELVELLREYMAGRVQQNGFLPGTQAFPSLHVGLAWCAVWVTARAWRWTLWLTIPWFACNWLATLFLGWHYAVDGVGGIVVMSIALYTSHSLMRLTEWGRLQWIALKVR